MSRTKRLAFLIGTSLFALVAGGVIVTFVYAWWSGFDVWRINPLVEIVPPRHQPEPAADTIPVAEVVPAVQWQRRIGVRPVAYDVVRHDSGLVLVGAFRMPVPAERYEVRSYLLTRNLDIVSSRAIDTLESADHIRVDADTGPAGVVHVIFSTLMDTLQYAQARMADGGLSWTVPEDVVSDATYGTLRVDGGRVMIVCRTGGHGQGWSLFTRRMPGHWTESRLVTGWGRHPAHAYLSGPELPRTGSDSLLFGVAWAYDFARFDGVHQYQRVTIFSLTHDQHRSLEGELVEGDVPGLLSHSGPRRFTKMGSVISNGFSFKGRGRARNALARLPLSAIFDGSRQVMVLSATGSGETPAARGQELMASQWDGARWQREVLATDPAHDFGTHYIEPVDAVARGPLWVVNQKNAGATFYSAGAGFSLVGYGARSASWRVWTPALTKVGGYVAAPVLLGDGERCNLLAFFLSGSDTTRTMRIKSDRAGRDLVAAQIDLCREGDGHASRSP